MKSVSLQWFEPWLLRSLGFHARLRQARIRVPADFDWLKDRPLRLLNTLGFYRSRIFSCFDPPEFLWQQVSDYVPDVLMGYSETVARVARYGLETRRSDIHPRFVLLGGELCTPLMRRHIAEAFQAPVYQTYAATEFNLIGWSCPQSGLFHLCDPTVLVEVLDNQGNPVAEGETGRVGGDGSAFARHAVCSFCTGGSCCEGPDTVSLRSALWNAAVD